MERDLVAEAAADVLADEPELVEPDPERRRHPDRADARHLVVPVDRPLAGAAVVLYEAAGALEGRRREAVEVEPLDPNDVVCLRERGIEVAPVEDARPDDVRARLLVENDLVLQRLLALEHRPERLVLDLNELRGVAGELAGARDHRRHRVADVAGGFDGERGVLYLGAGWRRQLEEGVGEDRDLVAG